MQEAVQDVNFAALSVAGDETTFCSSGKANRHNVWGVRKMPIDIIEHGRDSPDVYMFCTVSNTQVYGLPFVF